MTLAALLMLYIGFRLKQLTADFLLSSWSAADKEKPFGKGGFRGLSIHAGIHSACALVVLLLLAPHFWWIALVDFPIHFGVDKAKASISKMTGWTYKDSNYWRLFGLDQEAHNFTHLAYIIYIVTQSGGIVS
jgi:hypothetical protein